ncbi:MAG: TolC family protein [Deltaproteobacteria bacterium]|nr:TolC family protein [Deltaproteobacteria bacterium]MBW2417672.1 TolC family protein [Deltaproteobacteria bacterium]
MRPLATLLKPAAALLNSAAALLITAAAIVSLALPSGAAAQDETDSAGGGAGRARTREAVEGEKTGVYRGRRLTPSKENLPELRIALSDSIETGIKHNLNVEVQRYNPMIAGEAAEAAWGAYDPNFSLELGYLNAEVPTATILQGSDTMKTDGNIGFGGLIPLLGGTYQVGYTGIENAGDMPVSAIEPEYRSIVGLGVDVPLLKDLLHHEAWMTIETSALQHYSSLDSFRNDLIDVIFGIESAYWRVVATAEQLRVAWKSLDTAQALLDQTEIQYEVGVVSKVEVVQAEAGVADREFRLIVADADHGNAQDVLLDLVYGTRLRGDSRVNVVATDNPEDYVTYDIDPGASVQKAFVHRPDLAIARRTIQEDEVQLRFAKNQRLPGLNVQFDYGLQGLAGKPNSGCQFGCTPPTVGDTFGDAFRSMGDNPSYEVRGVFSIPIPNTAARRRVRLTRFELRQSSSQAKRLEQSIIVAVRRAARALEASQRGIVAAERARVASAEQLRAERIRLEHGESTPFDVLLKEETLVQAESQKIAALETYRTAIASLDREQGTTLESRKIQFDEVLSQQGPLR